MARLKAVLFDLGGTLMEDEGDRNAKVAALAAVNDRYGIPKSGEETLRWFLKDLGPYFAGQPEKWIPIRDHLRRNFIAYLRENSHDATADDCAWFERTYDAIHAERCRLYPDAIPAVHRVRATGRHVGLLTDVDEKFVRIILKAVHLAPLLDSVTTSEAVGVGKPNPRIFHAALAKAKCAPGEAVLVGDSRTRDVAGAMAVGMLALHLHRTGDPDPTADFTARTLTEAGDVLQGLLDG
jgi:HAD superfamily hydrolase (TIGR01509 family)